MLQAKIKSTTLREESNAEKSPGNEKQAKLKNEFVPKFAIFYSIFSKSLPPFAYFNSPF